MPKRGQSNVTDVVLVVNAGSSSIKFALFAGGSLALVFKGHVALVAHQLELRAQDAQGDCLVARQWAANHFDPDQAASLWLEWLNGQALAITAIGHRVVHGGQAFSGPVVIDDAVLATLDSLCALAPLHQPHNLQLIRVLRQRWPQLPQLACFDTAFHHQQPPLAQAFALPRAISQGGVRRYGFHGLSYEYIASQLPGVLGEPSGKVIVAHLGNGASLCALVDGVSCASTMGFSALDGLMMGTRCGALDPGVVLYLLQSLQMSPEAISQMLYQQSGLLGVSGISGDMQVLLASAAPEAAEAVDLFIYRITCEIGALAAAMGGLDALVFTAGIGEHAPSIRARVVKTSAWLGALLDDDANQAGQIHLHSVNSRVQILCIPTDEERMIARHCQPLLAASC